jgi:required for meiotic nuclear division protein 1
MKLYFPSRLDLIHRPTRLQGDLIVLGQMPELDASTPIPQAATAAYLPPESFHARYAFSHALARSTSLSALESSLDNYLSSVSELPDTLSSTGKPGLTRIELIKKLGELLKFRQGLNLNRENFEDVPDFYWAEASLESAHSSFMIPELEH